MKPLQSIAWVVRMWPSDGVENWLCFKCTTQDLKSSGFGGNAMSGVIGFAVLGLLWLAITVGMLLLYVLVVGPGLERLRNAAIKAIRSSASYEEMHQSDIALGVTGLFLVVGIGPWMVLTYFGLFGWTVG